MEQGPPDSVGEKARSVGRIAGGGIVLRDADEHWLFLHSDNLRRGGELRLDFYFYLAEQRPNHVCSAVAVAAGRQEFSNRIEIVSHGDKGRFDAVVLAYLGVADVGHQSVAKALPAHRVFN